MILEDREARYYKQIELNKKYKKPICVVRVNYPGDKNNYIVNSVFRFINIELTYLYKEVIHASEGPVMIFVVDEDAKKLKEYGLHIEDSPLGRMIDFDVYDEDFNQVSRSDFDIEPRTCIVCGEVAHECIVGRKHTLEEVQDEYDWIFIDYVSKLLGTYAKESLLEELNLHPKPGLITPFSNGSHDDMDYDVMKRSIESIDFSLLAKASFKSYKDAKNVGIKLENDMFEATKGINTHKGAIFLLSSIIFGFIYSLKNNIRLEESLKVINKGVTTLLKQPNYQSHGKTIYEQYGMKGILGDAEAGFPLLFKFLDLTGEDLLRQLMTFCDDSTILYRHDLETLNDVKRLSKSKSFEELDKLFVEKNISPGGSADLYAGVTLIQKIRPYL